MFRLKRRKTVDLRATEDLDKVKDIIANYEDRCKTEHKVIVELLQEILDKLGYVPEHALRFLSQRYGVPLSKLYGLSTFQDLPYTKPTNLYNVVICTGTGCHINGSYKLIQELQSSYGIEPGETTKDGVLSIRTVNCLGMCSLGPNVIINGRPYNRVNVEKLKRILDITMKEGKKISP